VTVLFLFLCFAVFGYGQTDGFQFIPNKGQWNDPYNYKVELGNGEIYFSPQRMIFAFWNAQQKSDIMNAMHGHGTETIPASDKVDAVGVYADFIGSNPNATIEGSDKYSFYHNYYLGNDPNKWASEVPVYKKMTYDNIYDGIKMSFYTDSSHLKYDWIVAPGANPKDIKVKYSGANSVAVFDGGLHIVTSVNDWIEQKPYAYQVINGTKVEIECDFVVKNDVVSFKIGKYDRGAELIIDPSLVFASYSGSVKDNWGYTATYDFNDNMYGGGIVFGSSAYPGTSGSYQLNFGGGIYDILLCKFTANGNNLLYYTYLGGAKGDAPLSLVCNNNNELFVLGVTGSVAFPVSAGAFQSAFAGGPSINATGYSSLTPDFSAGSDLFVTKFSPTGTALLASTFIGGTGNDGLNKLNIGLNYNYADEFRGEIIVDNSGNCYLTSCTKSSNFPVQSAFQPALQGSQDAVVCKLNSTLTTMIYSSYLGGTSDEAGYSLQLNSSNEVYVAGGTASSNFPTTAGVIKPAYSGAIDGFLTHLSAGGTILNSTYLGTSSYDQCYNVQLDNVNNPYVLGQTTGSYPISAGVYNNPNSGQFIHKLNANLSATGFSTVFGKGNVGHIDIVPTAFLVDVCNNIYVAGWGGGVNAYSDYPALHTGESTVGLPVTAGAQQTSTDGSDFYLIVLDANATSLQYATFFGGSVSDEHVDGGTSRFDKNGIVYEAVCAGCGGNSDFPTTPGAWSNTNNASNCNLGVFKFDISQFSAIIDPVTPTTICANGVVTLNNASTGGFSIQWDFGDGTFSTAQNVTHTYAVPGTYTVYLTVNAPGACLAAQMDSIIITVEAVPIANIAPVPPICNGDSIQLLASGGTVYVWDANSALSSTIVADPIAFPTTTTNFTVHVANLCGNDDASVTVTVINVPANAGPDITVCTGQTAQLNASGGVNYVWDHAATLTNPNIANPVASPSVNTAYAVTVTDGNGCSNIDTVVVDVDIFPLANAGPDQVLCYGENYQLNATGGSTYAWSPGTYLSDPAIADPISTPLTSIIYSVGATNSCGTDFDTVSIQVLVINANTVPDVIICPGDSTLLTATGGTNYTWTPNNTLHPPTGPAVYAIPNAPTTYIVEVTDTNGCSDFDTVFVDLYPATNIDLGHDVLIPFGGETQLFAHGTGTFTWTPDSFLTCANCNNPTASPFSSTEYIVQLIDGNGCRFYDSINVFVEGSLYVPNTFTPNLDEINPIFFAYGTEIAKFEMRIFNRWGQEIFFSSDLHHGWNGTYIGQNCPLGVYVWKIEYEELSGKGGSLIGHVNLLR
jgi:gliding motility-associated-like protein